MLRKCYFFLIFQEKDFTIIKLKDTFISLVTAAYIQQAPIGELKEGSEVPTLEPVATIVPELNTGALMQAASTGDLSEINDSEWFLFFLNVLFVSRLTF